MGAQAMSRQSERIPRPMTPGVVACLLVAAAAWGLATLEEIWLGKAWIEPLVLAILIGATVRLVWTPSERFARGIDLCAKPLLEIAVALLGATISAQALAAAGAPLLIGVFAMVVAALFGGYAIGKAMGLPDRMAVLIAAGNAICGNSAIAAVAPVIKADAKDVASAIGFTAVLGVAVVLLLPLAGSALGMNERSYGVWAGLTVYAVPQVLAAAAPMGPVAIQVGALVKLARVLMLGPICLVLGLVAHRLEGEATEGPRRRPSLGKLVPWFIVAFLALMTMRSMGWVPDALIAPLGVAVKVLTVIAMAGLGLGVDPRDLVRAGPRVAATAILTILLITAVALVPAVLLVGA